MRASVSTSLASLFAAAMVTSACGAKLDGSSEQAFQASVQSVTAGMIQPQAAAVSTAITTMELACRVPRGDTPASQAECAASVRQQLDGKSVSQLRELATTALDTYAQAMTARLALVASITSNPTASYDPAYPAVLQIRADSTNRGQTPLVVSTWKVSFTRPDGSRFETTCSPSFAESEVIAPGATQSASCSLELSTAFPGVTGAPPPVTPGVAIVLLSFQQPDGGRALWDLTRSDVEARRQSLSNLP